MAELERLENDLHENGELQAKYDLAIKAAAKNGAKTDAEAIVYAAKSLGYAIGISDLEKAAAAVQELSNDDLEQVAGGIKSDEKDEEGHSAWCVYSWHCYTAFAHTSSTNEKMTCWSNYSCVVVYE